MIFGEIRKNRQLHARIEFEVEQPQEIVYIEITCPICNIEISQEIDITADNFVDEDGLISEYHIECEYGIIEVNGKEENCHWYGELEVDGKQWIGFSVDKLIFHKGPPFKEKNKLLYSVEPHRLWNKTFTKQSDPIGTKLLSQCPNCDSYISITETKDEFWKTWDEVQEENKKVFTRKSRKSYRSWHLRRECLKEVN